MKVGSVLIEVGRVLETARSWRLSSKLLVLMALVAILPLALVIWQYDSRARAALQNSQRAEQQSAVRDTAQRLDGRIQERKLQVVRAGSNPAFARFAGANFEQSSQAADSSRTGRTGALRDLPAFDGAYIFNPRGEAMCSAGATFEGSATGREYFKSALSGTLSVSSFEGRFRWKARSLLRVSSRGQRGLDNRGFGPADTFKRRRRDCER